MHTNLRNSFKHISSLFDLSVMHDTEVAICHAFGTHNLQSL
jgi:hypothetical protein